MPLAVLNCPPLTEAQLPLAKLDNPAFLDAMQNLDQNAGGRQLGGDQTKLQLDGPQGVVPTWRRVPQTGRFSPGHPGRHPGGA